MLSHSRVASAVGVAVIPAVLGVAIFAAQRASGDGGGAPPAAELPQQSESTLLDLAVGRLTCAEGERHVSAATFDGDAHWQVIAQCLVDSPGGTHLTRDRFWWVSDADLSIDSAASSDREPPTSCSYTGTSCIGESGPVLPRYTFDLTVTPGSPRTPIR